MRRKLWIILFLMTIMVFAVSICHADNPVVQTKYTADPAPMVYDNTVFLYTGHDEDDATGFKMKNYLLYTTTDMANWTDRGIVASLSAFSWADPNNGAWASQCIYRNGKFYWYCAVQLRGIGVLVSTSPYGPFTDPLGKPLINNSSDDIDPTVWIDDDGQAYMYWGNPNCYYVKLNQDMISYSGGITKISSRPSDYQEGPWFHKRNGIYYLSYSSTCCPEGIGYAMSNSPTGPWTWKGKIMDPNSASSGNQPGIIDYKGTTYCFGFNYAINYLRTTVHNERRSVCVDVMKYNADGTIQKMPWWSTSGPPQIGALNPYVQTEAETICYAWDVKTEVCSEGGMDVCNIENGDYIKVKGVDFGTGATSFNARVASANSGGNIEIRLDSQTGTLVGTCAVSGTGGWQTWVTKSCNISGASGVHDLFFKFTGGSGSLMNFNWWKFSGGPTPTQGPTPTPTSTPTPTPTPIPGTISIAAGSTSAVGSFLADQYYSGGSTYSNTNTVDVSQITTNPPPAALFNNERYGAMSYTIPGFTAGNSYTVTLYLAETYLTSSGSRLFSVSINGSTVLSNFDIYASAGGQNKAIARSFTATANSSGQIVIQFTSGTENPKINGISIKPGVSNTPTPTPTGAVNSPTPSPTATPTARVTPTVTRQANTPTPTPTGSYVKFRNAATGLYIDGMGSTANGSNACQYSSSTNNNQQWTIITSGSYVLIQNRATGMYLDGMGRTSNGSVCSQYSYSGSNNQQWTRENSGNYVRFKNRATGLYLDGMGSTANGSNLCQWAGSGSTNQQWQIQ